MKAIVNRIVIGLKCILALLSMPLILLLIFGLDGMADYKSRASGFTKAYSINTEAIDELFALPWKWALTPVWK